MDVSVFGESADGVYAVAPDGTITLWNRAAEALFGYSASEVLGKSCWSIVAGCDTEGRLVCQPECQVRTLVRQGREPVHFPLVITTKDGKRVYLDVSIIAAPNRAPGKGTVVHVARDVSDTYEDRARRVRDEQELRKVHRALRVLSECNQALVRSSPEADLLHDVCRIIVDTGGYRLAWVGMAEQDEAKSVRPAAQAGYEAGYLDSVNITWADTDRGRGPTGLAIRTGEPVACQNILTDPAFLPWRAEAAKRGYASSVALPLTTYSGVSGALNIYAKDPDAFDGEELRLLTELARDLAYGLDARRNETARRRAEEALRESERRYRLLATNVTDIIWTVDLNLRRTYVSPSVTRLLGYGVEELIGQSILDVLAPESADLAGRILEEELAREWTGDTEPFRPRTLEVAMKRKDGSIVWSEATMTFLRDDDGRPVGILGVTRDITERKRAEEELHHNRETLYQTEKLAAMGQLLAGVAHELNNPLAVVTGRAALLCQKIGAGPAAEQAEKIAQAAQRCARIVRNFLALARQHPPERSSVELNQVVQEAVELLAYPLRVDDVEVTLDLDEDLPTLWADAHQLHQVVVNLVSNAHDAMRKTPAPRRLHLATRYDSRRDRVQLDVRDSGPGMSPEIQRRIFEPFFTTKPLGQGTGLGLPLCQGIMESHGGLIRAESRPGHGAVFVVELPAGRPPAVGTALDAPMDAPPVKGQTILVVDDEQEVAAMLADFLALDGHRVDTVPNGRIALERLGAGAYDLIISDVRMPELDGPGLYREIRRRHPRLLSRFVFVTGDVLSPAVRELIERTRIPEISKPFDLAEIRQALRRVLAA